ncbi:hypothetical protein ACFFGH_06485 [Lysobacter korlensis]|uniref:Uncharacterized protein n=1 Tax=Lysobacter korlensis TaxID=553636 RepID=A0ABV6RKI2_9GAMM
MAEIAGEVPAPKLRVVTGLEGDRCSDSIDIEWHCRMIRHLSKRWGLQLLVDQATRGYVALECVPSEDLAQLHRDLHRAYECINEGISLEDAGLIRERHD